MKKIVKSDLQKELKELPKELDELLDAVISGDLSDQSNPSIKSIAEFIRIRRLLDQESDRGCVLFAASHMDHKLSILFQKILIGNKTHLDSILAFNGPLGSFSSKTKLAYSLGILRRKEFEDIEVLRKIRNEFAHSIETLAFQDLKIKQLIRNFKLLANPDHDNPKYHFISIVGLIFSRLDYSFREATKFREPTELDSVNFKEALEMAKNIGIQELKL